MHIRGCVVFAVLVAVIAACSGSGTPVRPSFAETSSGQAANHTDSEPAAQSEAALSAELAAVRGATAAFHDVDAALAAGYRLAARCAESPEGAAMGIHAANPALVASQALDAEQPEQLLYLPQPDGGLRLIGVEYFQVLSLRNTATGQVGPWLSSAPWPSTYQVVTPTPELFGQVFTGPMPGHNPSQPWHWDLHMWIWAHNPSGMFAEYNPTLRCEP